MTLLDRSGRIHSRLVEWRRHLHRPPEPIRRDEETVDFLASEIREIGFRVRDRTVVAFIGIRNENLGSSRSLHSAHFRLDEECLWRGSALLASLVEG